jgi:hypothetical protein
MSGDMMPTVESITLPPFVKDRFGPRPKGIGTTCRDPCRTIGSPSSATTTVPR